MAVEETRHHRDSVDEISRAFVPGTADSVDFSLVMGGPLYQICHRSRLYGDELNWVYRRIILVALFTWLPLLLLSIAEGRAWAGSFGLSFSQDIEMHVRLLVALPLLVAAELVVHRRIPPIVVQFLERGLIPESARAAYAKAIDSTSRLRNSAWAEVSLLIFVYLVGIGILWRAQRGLHGSTWYGTLVDGTWQPTTAGWWLTCVSLPLFQFMLLRWYFRLFIWARFLWQVSRIKLNLLPTHPDGCGGMLFISAVRIAFAPLILAQGALLAGLMANRILYAGAKLTDFKVEVIVLVAAIVLAVLGPLLVFCRQLEATKRTGIREYGTLCQKYVRDYDRKWLRGGSSDEPFLGSSDIQSLADLANSFEVVRKMKWVPFSLEMTLQLAVVALVPVLPLMLTMISLEELLERLVKIIF